MLRSKASAVLAYKLSLGFVLAFQTQFALPEVTHMLSGLVRWYACISQLGRMLIAVFIDCDVQSSCFDRVRFWCILIDDSQG